MPHADVIRWDYDGLAQGARSLEAEAERARHAFAQLAQHSDLFRGGWEGPAADTFFSHMHNDVLPGGQRLVHALTLTHTSLEAWIVLLAQAEEDAAAAIWWGGEEAPVAEAGGGDGTLLNRLRAWLERLLQGDPAAADPIPATVGNSAVNTRLGPGATSPISGVGKLQPDTEVTIIAATADADSNGRWVLVETEDGQQVWVAAKFLNHDGDLDTLPQYGLDGQPLSVEAVEAMLRQRTLEEEYGLTIDMPPGLTGEERLRRIRQTENDLARLAEFGVDLDNTDGTRWTPDEITTVRRALATQAWTVYQHAQRLAYDVDDPAQAFRDTFLRKSDGTYVDGLTYVRQGTEHLYYRSGTAGNTLVDPANVTMVDGVPYAADGTRLSRAYAWISGTTITLSDAALAGGTSLIAGLPFTGGQLVGHENAHRLDFQGLAAETWYGTVSSGDYRLLADQTVTYTVDGETVTTVIPAGTTIDLASVNAGYAVAARSSGYSNGVAVDLTYEIYTDAMMASMLMNDNVAYTTGADHTQDQALAAAARMDQADELWRLTLEEIYGPPPADD